MLAQCDHLAADDLEPVPAAGFTPVAEPVVVHELPGALLAHTQQQCRLGERDHVLRRGSRRLEIAASASCSNLQASRQGTWRSGSVCRIPVVAHDAGHGRLEPGHRRGPARHAAARRVDTVAQAVMKAQRDKQLAEHPGNGHVVR
jgi:hypothetical protein